MTAKGFRPVSAIAFVAIIFGTATGITGTSSATDRGAHRISGDVVVNEFAAPGDLCGTAGRTSAYSDIAAGTNVMIKPAGRRGVPAPLGQGVGNADSLCEFPFSAQVPDARRYVVVIAERGSLAFTKRDLRLREWEVLLTIGTGTPGGSS